MTLTNREGTNRQEAERERARRDHRPGDVASVSWVAWTASGIGLLLFLGAVGLLVYDGLTRRIDHPVIVVSLEEVARNGDGWLARFRAENRGGATAAQVRVEGTLEGGMEEGGDGAERAMATFDFLPVGSTRHGGLFFDRRPTAATLRLRVLGYVRP